MPRVIKKKLRKKTASEPEVADIIGDLKNTLKERQRNVIRYGALGAAVILIVSVFLIYRYNAALRADQLEYEAYKTYHALYQKTPLPRQEQFQKALDLFREAYSKKASPRMLFYIAGASYELEKYDDALATLNEFTQKYAAEKDLLPLVYQKIALVHMKKGNSAEALKTLDTMYKSDNAVYKDLALVEAARILEKEGRKEEAQAKYKELAEKYPDSPFVEEARAKAGLKTEKTGQK